MRITVILSTAALLAAPAVAASPITREFASTQKLLATLTPGPPIGCITLSRTRDSRYADADTIVYRDTTRRYYVDRTGGGCGFDRDVIVSSSTPSDRLCRGDILRTTLRGSGIQSGSCSLGDFTPYTR